jgi:hypothetical protein
LTSHVECCFEKKKVQKETETAATPLNYSKSILEVYSGSAIKFVGAEDLHPFTASESSRQTEKQLKIQMKG